MANIIPSSSMSTILFLYAGVLTFTLGFSNARHAKNDIFNIASRGHEAPEIGEQRDSSDEEEDENQTWIIIGVVCGTVLAAIIIIIVMLCLCRRKLGKGERQWFWTRRSEVKASAKPVIIMEMSRVNQQVPVPVPVSPHRPSTDTFPTAPSSASISTFPDPPTPATTTIINGDYGDDDFYQGPFNQEFQPVYEELPPPYDFAVAVHEPSKVKL